MNLSSDTVAVLKNFSDINQNILVKPGNKVQTISTMKNILAEAEVTEKFEDEFAIYDLPEFLRSVELFEKPELKFNGGGYVNISQSKQSIKYFFADKSVIVAPTKGISMPDKFVDFTITKDNFARLMKGTTTLNLPDVAVEGDGKTIKMIATDKKNKSSNRYSIDVGETDKVFTFNFKVENIKIIPGPYDVAVSSKLLSKFQNTQHDLTYFIALEPDSTFG